MEQPSLQSQVNAALAYESLFVPALFGQWAAHLANSARVEAGQTALDVACGTGILTREIESRVGPQGRTFGLDPSPGMLAVARKMSPGVDWREGTAESLPFLDGTFDAVLSQFGLMFFQDKKGAIEEMLRVLKPTGRLAIAVWDDIENIPGYSMELELVERLAGTHAANAVRAPFILGGRDDLRALLRESGAVRTEVKTHAGKARFPSIRAMVEAELRGWLPVMGVNLGEDVIEATLREAETALSPYRTAEGAVVFDVTAHLVTAQKV